jgi:DNA-binding XRE family transcriptional regulator
MTTLATTSVPAAWLHGQSSEAASSHPAVLLVYDGGLTQPMPVPGATSMADYAKESAQRPERVAALAKARQRLASELDASPLAVLRLQAGLSQQQMAERMGVTQPQIARCEQARHDPGTETIARMARALELSEQAVFEAVRVGLQRRVAR